MAVFTINRLPSSVLQNVSSFEKLFGRTPDYTLLRPFGCVCFVMLPPHERTKLQPRVRLCCFLGYGFENKEYRCWDPFSKRLRISRHVTFWEHTMFSILSKFSSPFNSSSLLFSSPSPPVFSSSVPNPSSPDSLVPSPDDVPTVVSEPAPLTESASEPDPELPSSSDSSGLSSGPRRSTGVT